MNRLIIEGKEADLTSKNVNINFQINKIGDIATRNSTFSNTIDLPRTSNNEAIFEMINVNGSNTRSPYKKLRCTYIQDNITLINNGYLQLMEIDNDSFKCNIFDGIIDLAERLKDKTLADLDYPTFVLDMTTFENTFSFTDGFIYGLARFNKSHKIINYPTEVWDITKQAPSLYVHTIFDKIMTDAGFTYEGDVFSDAGYKIEVITLEKGVDINNKEELGKIKTNTNSGIAGGGGYDWKYFSLQPIDPNLIYNVSGNRINMTATQNLLIDINVSSESSKSGTLDVEILRNGVSQKIETIPKQSPYRFSHTIAVNSGDYLEFRSKGNSTTVGASYSANMIVTMNKSLTIQVVDIKAGLGESISQVDFIKDIMQRYGLVMKADVENKNHLYFENIETILNDRANAIDLTEMFDYEKKKSFKLDYTKENIAEYEYEDESANRDNYDGTLIVNNENIKTKSTLFKSPFKISTRENIRDGADNMISIYDVFLWESRVVSEVGEPDVIVYEKLESDVRLFKISNFFGDTSYSYNGVTTSLSQAPFLTLQGLNLQFYLDKYYPSFNNLIDDYKEIKVQMNLNTIDLLKMDFFKLVYLKQYQAYFYLQKYTNNGEVTLLRINKFI